MRVLWTVGRSNQSILKVINSEHSLEGLMLKLKFQYFGHMMRRPNSLAKTLMLEKIESRRRRGRQRMRQLDGVTDAIDTNLGKLWEMVRDREGWHASVYGVTKSDMTWQLNNSNGEYRHTSFYWTLKMLHFLTFWKVCGHPALSKSIGAIFSN